MHYSANMVGEKKMKLETDQYLLLIAAAVSTIMLWTSAMDRHVMAFAFFGELAISVGLFAMSVRRSRNVRREPVFRKEEEY